MGWEKDVIEAEPVIDRILEDKKRKNLNIDLTNFGNPDTAKMIIERLFILLHNPYIVDKWNEIFAQESALAEELQPYLQSGISGDFSCETFFQ